VVLSDNWFDDSPVLGSLVPSEAAVKLRQIGDVDSATTLEAGAGNTRGAIVGGLLGVRPRWAFQDRAWQHTGHAFGYVAPDSGRSRPQRIQHAGAIAADADLKHSRIKITLDRLRVAEYPGSGNHLILFDFYAQNQTAESVEHVHFNATFRVRQGEQAPILGYPIFVGLRVGSEGVAFKCFTVNVKNEDDEALLSFLDSDVFKAGLRLASTLQPAVAPLSGMAYGLTKNIAARNRNVPVQDFFLGLDFSDIGTRGRLAEGSYVVVQVPDTLAAVWDWRDWTYNPANGHIVRRGSTDQHVPYNYLVLGVSRMRDEVE
jgi:hypothetical protein